MNIIEKYFLTSPTSRRSSSLPSTVCIAIGMPRSMSSAARISTTSTSTMCSTLWLLPRRSTSARVQRFSTSDAAVVSPGILPPSSSPECKFKLIDGTGKKIKVCNEVAGAIGLKNLVAEHLRGEDEKGKYDFVVSRAVMQLDPMKIIKKNFKKAGQNALPNGLLCLKGGNLKEELKQYYKISEITPLSTFFDEEWFSQDKQLVYVPA